MLSRRQVWLSLVLVAALGGGAAFVLRPQPLPPAKITRWHLALAPQPPVSPSLAARLELARSITGHGMASNAPTWLSLARDGNVEAEAVMASLYMAGIGVDKNPGEAAKWYLKSADDGNPESEMMVANAYKGYRQQRSLANSDIYKRLDPHVKAMMNDITALYIAIHTLKPAVGDDDQEAAKWVLRAANYGLFNAQNDMVGRYMAGNGVPKDLVQAYKWSLILSSGPWGSLHEKASGMLGLDVTFGKMMTPEQIAEAKQLAEQWHPTPIPAPPLPPLPDD